MLLESSVIGNRYGKCLFWIYRREGDGYVGGNGRTEFRDSNGKEYHYRIRQETQIVIDDEETRRLLKELGTLVFHDFHRQVTMKIDVDGALYEKSANESWKKLSRKAKLSR